MNKKTLCTKACHAPKFMSHNSYYTMALVRSHFGSSCGHVLRVRLCRLPHLGMSLTEALNAINASDLPSSWRKALTYKAVELLNSTHQRATTRRRCSPTSRIS